MIAWPQDRCHAFFKRLMASHAQAVKALELAHGHAAPVDASTLRIKLDGMQISDHDTPESGGRPLRFSDQDVRDMLAASQVSVQHHSMPGALPEEAAAVLLSDADVEAEVEALRRGDWFELQRDGRRDRLCLRWVSPKQSFYLFTEGSRMRPHSLGPDTLREYLRRGYLRRLENTPLFERAVKDVMKNLQDSQQSAGRTPPAESMAA
jgi:hypothetical protein